MKRKFQEFALGQVVYNIDDDVYARIKSVRWCSWGWAYQLHGEAGFSYSADCFRALTAKEKGQKI